MMLWLAKRAVEMARAGEGRQWSTRSWLLPYISMAKRFLIVSFGRIGHAHAHGVPGDGNDRSSMTLQVSRPRSGGRACEPVSDLDAALPRADFVMRALPKTPGHGHVMFNRARLKPTHASPTAYLISRTTHKNWPV